MRGYETGDSRRKGSPNALCGDNGALRSIESAGPSHQVGHYDGEDCSVDARPDAVEELHSHQPVRIVRKGVEGAAYRQDQQGYKKQGFAPPAICLSSNE